MVDIQDTKKIHIYGTNRTYYRTYCDECKVDRGYQTKQTAFNSPLCKTCVRIKGHSLEIRKKIGLTSKGRPCPTKGKTLSIQTRIKISCTNQNIDVKDFIGFTKTSNEKDRLKFKELKLHLRCFERDSYNCQKCNKHGVHLNAHHKNSWKHFPDQRFELNNLITLCKICHDNFHECFGNGKKLPNTEEQVLIFLSN